MMKLCPGLCCVQALLVLCCAFAADTVPAPPVPEQLLSRAMKESSAERDQFAAEVQLPEKNLKRLGEPAPWKFDPAAPMPAAPKGHSAVVSDGGLVYDHERSTLSYLGNVRLNDERVQLRAAYRLYIHLPEHGNNKHSEDADAKQAPPTAPPAAPTAAPQSAPKPPTPAAPKPAPAPAKEQEEPPPPAIAVVENAAVDLLGSRALLEGRKSRPSLTINREGDSLTMDAMADGTPARIYAARGGDILMLGRNITFIWRDAEGGQWRLVVPEGPVYYYAAYRYLVALGKSVLTSPSYSMLAHRALYIGFAEDESAPAPTEKQLKQPFSQFTTIRFRDVELAYAYGDVRLTGAADAAGGAPSSLHGEALRYEAASGECRVYGEPCTLEYGADTMVAPGSITLAGNGDILISSAEVSGIYERPYESPEGAPTEQATPGTTRGTYRAAGPITYNAQRNCIILPRGIVATDAHGAFSCTGQLTAYLSPRPGAAAPKPPRPGMRMPNLAIARQGGISRLVAEERVRLRSDASATTPAYRVNSDYLESDLNIGTASLRSAPSQQLEVYYGEYILTAKPAKDEQGEAHLLSNGDLRVAADRIHATLPGEEGPTLVDCTESLVLQRVQALLTLGPASRIAAPGGVLTARKPLTALLAEGPPPATPPSHQQRFPQLSYNFSGLRRMDTPGGGTLRTPQASLECEGAISLELKPNAQMKDGEDARSLIRHATARKRVQVASKDSDGRLIRATGDRLDFESSSGNFYLRGNSVTLVDEFNTHTAYGRGACITVDPQNNVHITGESHITTATHLQQQMDNQKKQKKQP